MPEWKDEIQRRLARKQIDPATEAAIVDEWAQHLEDRYNELRAEGRTAEDARRAVLAELNESDLAPVDLAVPMAREPLAIGGGSGGGNFASGLWQDLRYGWRMLRSKPGFAAVVALTLGLGIGANTTVFTVINTLLLNPLPVKEPSRMVAIYSTDENKGSRSTGRLLEVSYRNLEDYKARNEVFSSVAGYSSIGAVTRSTAAGSERLLYELVTADYFETLGVRPAIGRFFLPEETENRGAHPVAVLSYGAWQQHFGGASDIVGQTLRLNNLAYTVVGVAPRGFIGVNAVFGPDLWIPAMMAEQVSPVQYRGTLDERSRLDFHGAARLKPGVTRTQAQANLQTIASALEKTYPDANEGRGVALTPIADAALGDTKMQTVFGSAVLMAFVGLVLLIACSNVANLLLARAAARRHEVATRLALGASRRRLVRQLLTESVLLALIGGALGLGIADEGLRLLWSVRPADVAANFVNPRLDGNVLLFALAASLLTGLIFGIAPALQSSRTDVVDALKEESRTMGRSRRSITFGNALLVGQVALSLVSLVTAGLFLHSIQRAYTIDPGFDAKHLIVVLTNPGQAGYDQARTEQFYRAVRDRLSALQGVASVSWASNLPFWSRAGRGVLIEGQVQRTKSDTIPVIANTIGLDYFKTAGTPLTNGRGFTDSDRAGSLPVAIINENMAQRYWPGQDPIGKRFKFAGENDYRQIVGVAKNASYTSLGESPQPCVFLPLKQNFSDSMVLYVKSTREPSGLLTAVQREMRSVAPEVNVRDIRTGATLIDQALFTPKIGVGLLGVFGALALGLACIGLYGMMAYSVARRRREIGVRMAMGAGQAKVLRLILGQGMTLVGIGIGVGLALSLLVGRALSRMLYGIGAADPVSFAGASIVLAAVAALACYWPARRASRVDPQTALRES